MDWRDVVAIFAGGVALYSATLAPTVVWGDDGMLQIRAIEGRLNASAGGHPAWVMVAHLFTRLPFGEPAFRVNLTSALWGAVTLCMLYLIMRTLGITRSARWLAVGAFGVSHTFWAHAVRPEVYAMTLAMSALLIWAALEWSCRGAAWRLAVVGLTFGLTLATHVLTLLYVPALAWLFVAQRKRLTWPGAAALATGAAVTLTPLALLAARDARIWHLSPLGALRWCFFSTMSRDFSESFFGTSPATLAADLSQGVLFIGYQFVGLALVLLIVGFFAAWRRLPGWQAVFVLLLYLGPAAFAVSYQVGDRYVFYLPSYLALVLWLGLGSERLVAFFSKGKAGPQPRVIAALLTLLVLTPVIVYRLTSDVMAAAGISFREGRMVPGPGARYFLLWPPKNGYDDARVYAEQVLAKAPPGSLILADEVLAAPMQFLQRVEKARPDVRIELCCSNVGPVLAANADRPIVLADIAPEIYPVEELHRSYRIAPVAPIYVLTPLGAP